MRAVPSNIPDGFEFNDIGDVPKSGDFIRKNGLLLQTRGFQELGKLQEYNCAFGDVDNSYVMYQLSNADWALNHYEWDGTDWHTHRLFTGGLDSCLEEREKYK